MQTSSWEIRILQSFYISFEHSLAGPTVSIEYVLLASIVACGTPPREAHHVKHSHGYHDNNYNNKFIGKSYMKSDGDEFYMNCSSFICSCDNSIYLNC